MDLPSRLEVNYERTALLLSRKIAGPDPAPDCPLDNAELVGRLPCCYESSHVSLLRRFLSAYFSADMLGIRPDGLRTCARPMSRRLVVNGRKARRLRDSAKLTQEAAAVRIGLAASTLRRIEMGSESVQLATLGKIADLYGVNPCDLLKRG
jgi:DNA-binding XRE family transcriptional regulator